MLMCKSAQLQWLARLVYDDVCVDLHDGTIAVCMSAGGT